MLFALLLGAVLPIALSAQSPASPTGSGPYFFAEPGKYHLTEQAKARKTDHYRIGDLALYYASNGWAPGWYYPTTQWHEPANYTVAPANFVPGDFNGDGRQDLAVSWSVFPHTVMKPPYPVTILLNDRKGNLVYSPDAFPAGMSAPSRLMHYRIRAADFNRDGADDLIVGSFGILERDSTGRITDTNEPLSLILSDGKGMLYDASDRIEGQESGGLPTGYRWAHDLSVGDVNGDGAPDFFAGKCLFLNDGSGRFRQATEALPPQFRNVLQSSYIMSSAMGDVDGDGVDDIVVLLVEGKGKRNFALLSAGAGSELGFAVLELPDGLFGPENTKSNYAVVADLTGDGWNDILIAETRSEPYYKGRVLQLLVNKGNGKFADESSRLSGDDRAVDGHGEAVTFVRDVNADGFADIVDTMGNYDGISKFGEGPRQAAVLLNDGTGRFAAITETAVASLSRGDLNEFNRFESMYRDIRYPMLAPIDLDGRFGLDWVSSFQVPLTFWPIPLDYLQEWHLYTIHSTREINQSQFFSDGAAILGAPAVSSALILHSASLRLDRLSPRQIFRIYGANLGPATEAQSPQEGSQSLPVTLAGVQVLVGGQPAPLIGVSSGEIRAVAPAGLDLTRHTTIQVTYQGNASKPVNKPVASTAPGVFTMAESGRGIIRARNADGSEHGEANPIKLGETLDFYVTGAGNCEPPLGDGEVAAEKRPLQATVRVWVGGQEAEVVFAGVLPGTPSGISVVTIRIPQDLPRKGKTQMVLMVGEALAQPGLEIWIGD